MALIVLRPTQVTLADSKSNLAIQSRFQTGDALVYSVVHWIKVMSEDHIHGPVLVLLSFWPLVSFHSSTVVESSVRNLGI